MSRTKWWWVRHAPVTTNNGHLYGQDDLPADTDDEPTYAALARLLPENAVLVTSNLQRTAQTAAAIAAAGLVLPEAIVEADLAEQHFGDWQGLPHKQVYELLEPKHPFWILPAHSRAPNGESFVEVLTRVERAVTRLNEEHAGRDIIAVAHAGSIRAAIGVALGLDPERSLGFTIHNCSVTRLDHVRNSPHHPDGAWAMVHMNHIAVGH